MAIITNTVETYDVVDQKEDKQSGVVLFEREATPLYSDSKKFKPISDEIAWFNDTLVAPAANAMIQGDEFTVEVRPQATQQKNYTQILRKVASVTKTNQAVAHYANANALTRETGKMGRELKRDIELALIGNAASVKGSTGVAGILGGFESYVTTNASRGTGGAGTGYNTGTGLTVAPTDGTQRPITEAIVQDVMQSMWTNGVAEMKKRVLFCGAAVKKQISNGFSGNSTRFVEDTKNATSVIALYETDFGMIAVALHPQIRTRTALLVDMDHFEVGILRPMKAEKKAKTNDSDEAIIVTELTSRVREKAHGVIADLTTA